MKAFATDGFALPLPPGHRFPLDKYRLLRERVSADGFGRSVALGVPPAAPDTALRLVHTSDYVARIVAGGLTPAEERRLGLPWSTRLVERARRSVGATLAACEAALADGIAASLAGGTHHAFADRGEGFCVFNDAAVAVRSLVTAGRVRRVLIVDCDVHQGHGTAALLATDPAAFILDVFAEHNYPFTKVPVDIAVALPDGAGDADYLAALHEALPRAYAASDPDLVIYLAGADPFAGDRLGRLRLSKAGLAARDRLVLDTAARARTPVAITMAGGYAADVRDTVDIQAETLRLAAALVPASR